MNVNIQNPTQFVDMISSNESRDMMFTISVDDNFYEGESLELMLLVSNESNNWSLPIPTYVYGPKLELSGYEVLDSSALEPGIVSVIDLLFHNSGSRDIEGLFIELDDSNDFIQIIENNNSVIDIPSGEQVIVNSVSKFVNSWSI